MSTTRTATSKTRPVVLDLFCGAGGTSMGLYQAGFAPVGLDTSSARLKRYPFPHVLMDITELTPDTLTYLIRRTNAVFIFAGPPCQAFSTTAPLRTSHKQLREVNPGKNYTSEAHPPANLIAFTRALINNAYTNGIDTPFVIENVPGSQDELIKDRTIQLCGSSAPFRLRVRRHRLFEHSKHLELHGTVCDHGWQDDHKPYVTQDNTPTGVLSVYGTSAKGVTHAAQKRQLDQSQTDLQRVAMGIDWMSARDLSQAIPPAFTNFLGLQVIPQLRHAARAKRTKQRKRHA